MSEARPPRVLAIAGSDSSGGAGIQADIKTITMLGGYAMTAITAVTAQNTVGVQAVELLPAELVGAQIDSCLSDIGVDAVKIGMLGSPTIAAEVARRLESVDVPVVFDPVMVATSGAALADDATVAAFDRLIRLATVVTPNLLELQALGGEKATVDRCRALLVKGGHDRGAVLTERLLTRDGEISRWDGKRIETRHTHGTGCTLSSAIATLLGRGLELEDAVREARRFVRDAIKAAPGFGSGAGPMGHQQVKREWG